MYVNMEVKIRVRLAIIFPIWLMTQRGSKGILEDKPPNQNQMNEAPKLKRVSRTLAVKQRAEEPSVAAMLGKIIDKGITTENVSALEALVGLYDRMQAKEAEKQFNAAFVDLKKALPQINATKPVPNNDGTVRYRYAPLEEIDAEIRPLALQFGFTYSFSEGEQQPDRITKILTIYHVGGHSRSNAFTVRRSAPPKATDTQADGSTHSYAKRGALCDGFGIIIDHDDDARMIGKPISKAQAAELAARVTNTKSDEIAFLKFAGVEPSTPQVLLSDYEQISDERFDALDEILRRKEGKLI